MQAHNASSEPGKPPPSAGASPPAHAESLSHPSLLAPQELFPPFSSNSVLSDIALSRDLPESTNTNGIPLAMLSQDDRPQRSHRVEDEEPDEQQNAEHSPLLRGQEQASLSGEEEEHSLDGYSRPAASLNVFTVTIAASLLILILDVVASVPMTPRLVMFEEIICRNYYNTWGSNTTMNDCKVAPVQSELALINGWKETFDTIPGALVSIPYGVLANHIGRANVLLLAMFGTLLSECWLATVCWLPQTLPLRSVWLSGAFQLIGGGGATVISMCYTMIADVCSPRQRTAAFSQVHAAVLLSEIISIPLGSALISVDPWIPILGSIAIMLVALILALLLSGRCFPASPPKPQSKQDGDGASLSPVNRIATANSRHLLKRLDSILSSAIASWLSRDVLLMLVAFFCCQLSRQFSSVLLQFSSYKFSWDYAQASYLLPLRAGINLAVLFLVIPRVLRHMTGQKGLAQWQADKYVTLISGVFLAVGSVLIFLSETPFTVVVGQSFIALGLTFMVTARSFLTAMVDPRYMSLLYTSVTSVTYAGLIIGGPVFAAAFQWGLKLGGIWVGMPFLIAAILFLVATLSTSAATVTK